MFKVVEIKDNGLIDNYLNYYGITWEVTSNCNFKCRYCALNRDEPPQDTKKIVNFINKLNKKTPVMATLFGGEPTNHPDILEIIENLECEIKLFTNLSKNLSFYEEVLRLKPKTHIETTYHNDRKNFEEFFYKVKKISETARVTVYLMLDSKYKDTKELYSRLISLNIEVSVLRVHCDDQEELPKEEEEWFKGVNKGDAIIIVTSEGREFSATVGYVYAHNLNNFKYFRCLCGKRNMYISSKGLCYPCLDYKNKELPFFDIHNPNEEELNKTLNSSTICVMERCTSEISTPKKRVLLRKGK